MVYKYKVIFAKKGDAKDSNGLYKELSDAKTFYYGMIDNSRIWKCELHVKEGKPWKPMYMYINA
jgi:hypothetical protein